MMDLDSDGAAMAAVVNEGSSPISIETNEEAIWQMNLRELESELCPERPWGSEDITSISIGWATLREVRCRTRGGPAWAHGSQPQGWCKECSMIKVALQELISKGALPVPQQDLNVTNREQPSHAVILIIIKRKLEDEVETRNNLSIKMSHGLVRRPICDGSPNPLFLCNKLVNWVPLITLELNCIEPWSCEAGAANEAIKPQNCEAGATNEAIELHNFEVGATNSRIVKQKQETR